MLLLRRGGECVQELGFLVLGAAVVEYAPEEEKEEEYEAGGGACYYCAALG
jgi:hypothetical protein